MRKAKETISSTDLSKLLEPYENQWVALSPRYDRVMSSGGTLGETVAKVKEAERSRVILYRVLPANSFYAPSA